MNIWPAQKDRQLFVIVFISVILILLFGSVIYKYGYTSVPEDTTDIYQTIAEDITPVKNSTRSTIDLQLQPTQNEQADGVEYQLVLNGVEEPVIGIALRLVIFNADSTVSISDVTTNQDFTNGPWQVIINKSGIDAEDNQPNLQFAATSTDLNTSIIGNNTILGSFTVTGSTQPVIEIAEDSLLTTEDNAYEIVLSNN